nr:hypothetical protein [Amycolatopsis kentuckyensis]
MLLPGGGDLHPGGTRPRSTWPPGRWRPGGRCRRPAAARRSPTWPSADHREAIELPSARGWFLGLQRNPEDTAATDPARAALFGAFAAAAGQPA